MPPAGGRTTPPIFFPKKENGRCDRPKERRLIGSPKLEQPLCLRNATACVRRCRVSIAIRLASASIIRCRSAYLVGVQTNFRLPQVPSMRRAKQCRIRQAVCRRATVTRVSRSKARLRVITRRRDSWRSHVHRTYIAQRVQSFKLQTANVRGRGALPSPFSGGFNGGILFGKRIPPLVPRRARRSPSRAYAGKGAALSGYPSLRAARGKHLRPCGRKKRAPLRVLFFKSLRISRTGTSGRLRR